MITDKELKNYLFIFEENGDYICWLMQCKNNHELFIDLRILYRPLVSEMCTEIVDDYKSLNYEKVFVDGSIKGFNCLKHGLNELNNEMVGDRDWETNGL